MPQLRNCLNDFVDGFDHIGVWLFENVEDDSRLTVKPPGAIFVCCIVRDVRDFPQVYWRTVGSLQHNVLKIRGVIQLVVGYDGKRMIAVRKRAFREIGGGVRNKETHLLDR